MQANIAENFKASAKAFSKAVAEDVAWFVVEQTYLRHGKLWLGGPIENLENSAPALGGLGCELQTRNIQLSSAAAKKVAQSNSLIDLLTRFHIRSVREDSQRALVNWINGIYPIDCIEFIPTPLEMLKIQCQGRRYVSWLHQVEFWDQPIGRHHGSLGFLLHDLEHADKFFHNQNWYRGQRNFFNLILKSWEKGMWQELYLDQPFAKDFDYVMADMNSHPLHLLKYLKAIVLMQYLRALQLTTSDSLPEQEQQKLEDFWRLLFSDWGMSHSQNEAAIRLNRPGLERPEDALLISNFFTDSSFDFSEKELS